MLGPMAAPAWTPTQQVRALLLLHETAALLAAEARACTPHGHPQLAAQLSAVGKRHLPPALAEMTEWSALRLAGSKEHLRAAIAQYQDSSAWAERLTAEVAALLRQGQRLAEALAHLHELAPAIAADDEAQARLRLDRLLEEMQRAKDAAIAEEADGAPAWDAAIELLQRVAAALDLACAATAAASGRSGGPPVSDRSLSHSSTPYQPSTATELGSDAGGSHALRRRR